MVCQTFGCTPDAARRQDWADVRAILDYRNAEQAVELFNEGAGAAERLEANPHLVRLLLEMHRAQGAEADAAGLVADMRARGGEG